MSSVNTVILLGNLGADPDLKYTPTNRAICNLSLATNEVFKDSAGARQERTEWHRVTVWGELAENCSKYLAKGRSVYVEGRLQTRSWDDKDGRKRYSTEIVADRVVFLGGGGDQPVRAGATTHSRRKAEDPLPSERARDEDIPI
jgi:single-strand DNA-binding protein